jgi:spore coat protein CotH
MKTIFAFYRKLVCIFIFNALNIAFVKAQLTFSKNDYTIDKNLHLIICNRIPDKISSATTVTFDKTYTFSSPINTINIGTAYDILSDSIAYKLYFTRLPIINLSTNATIGDDYITSTLTVSDTTGNPIVSNAGIKLRGNLSRTFPKKSYHVQLWTDSTGKETQNQSFFGMRSDQTWLLLAMYNEKLRLNNKLSHDLWLKMHKLYYAADEPDANSTIRTKYVEVFLNNAYQGVYLFTEDLDRKQLKLKKQSTSTDGGELYKGENWDQGTLFSGVPDLPVTPTVDWGGWELDYPDTTNWVNLRQFTDFAVNASDSTFAKQISSKIKEDNFIDYFLFLNLTRAEDNTGKNLFLARYNTDEPYFIAPWDLDGTWGYHYDGTTINVTNDILLNNLFGRLINGTKDFKLQLATRWFTLRKTTLSLDSLTSSVDTDYYFLSRNGVYERENIVWSGDLLSYSHEELDYIHSWIQNRLIYLDSYFKSLAQEQPIIYSFKASILNKSAVLDWSANCIAINSFDIEHSTDNITWSPVNGYPIFSNDSLPCQYTLTDINPGGGLSYYRLKVTNLQNGISYSAVQEVAFKTLSSSVIVFPNPASTSVQVQGDVEKINLYSLRGDFVNESDSSAPNKVDVKSLPTGTYLVRVTETNGVVSTHKVVVNR